MAEAQQFARNDLKNRASAVGFLQTHPRLDMYRKLGSNTRNSLVLHTKRPFILYYVFGSIS